jgi:hypothetical protein
VDRLGFPTPLSDFAPGLVLVPLVTTSGCPLKCPQKRKLRPFPDGVRYGNERKWDFCRPSGWSDARKRANPILHSFVVTGTLRRADPRHQSPSWTSDARMAERPSATDRQRSDGHNPESYIAIAPTSVGASLPLLEPASLADGGHTSRAVACRTTTAFHQGRRHGPTAVHSLDLRYPDAGGWRPFCSHFHPISPHRPPRSANRLTHDAGNHTV